LVIETNASQSVSAVALSQCHIEEVLNPVLYSLITHMSTESNYDIYEMEPMTIVEALEEWSPECKWAL
jgi:hypothetical protein